jgi:hypothetical protein
MQLPLPVFHIPFSVFPLSPLLFFSPLFLYTYPLFVLLISSSLSLPYVIFCLPVILSFVFLPPIFFSSLLTFSSPSLFSPFLSFSLCYPVAPCTILFNFRSRRKQEEELILLADVYRTAAQSNLRQAEFWKNMTIKYNFVPEELPAGLVELSRLSSVNYQPNLGTDRNIISLVAFQFAFVTWL